MKTKAPLTSKKFIAAMTFNATWLVLLSMGIDQSLEPSTLQAMIYCAGMVQGLYLGGQSFVDAWINKSFGGANESE